MNVDDNLYIGYLGLWSDLKIVVIVRTNILIEVAWFQNTISEILKSWRTPKKQKYNFEILSLQLQKQYFIKIWDRRVCPTILTTRLTRKMLFKQDKNFRFLTSWLAVDYRIDTEYSFSQTPDQ